VNLPPRAERGKPVRRAWDGLVQWAKNHVLRAGPGVRLTRGADGTTISFHAPRQSFRGAFRATLAGDRATVGLGTVDGIEPTIGGKKISGEPGEPPPSIKLDPGKYNADGKSWLCVQVRIAASGRIDTEARDAVTLIQSDHPHSSTDTTAHVPLAMLRRADPKKTDTGTLHQIAYWNLRAYLRQSPRKLILAP
jgi:hypothetical protein